MITAIILIWLLLSIPAALLVAGMIDDKDES
jgi:hypothetical protein